MGFNKYHRKKIRSQKKRERTSMAEVKVYMSKETEKILRQIGFERNIPISRLIAIAVDNELDTEVPFNYPCELPETTYKEYLYAAEAGKIMDWLSRCPHGADVDILCLARRDMGIETRETLLEGLRELLEKDIIEVFAPHISSRASKHSLRVRVKDASLSVKRNKSFRQLEGESFKHVPRIKDDEIDRGET